MGIDSLAQTDSSTSRLVISGASEWWVSEGCWRGPRVQQQAWDE